MSCIVQLEQNFSNPCKPHKIILGSRLTFPLNLSVLLRRNVRVIVLCDDAGKASEALVQNVRYSAAITTTFSHTEQLKREVFKGKQGQ